MMAYTALSIASRDKKGCGFAHVTHFCMRTVDLGKISSWHAVIGGINKTDDRLLLIAPTAAKAGLGLNSIGLICHCICYKVGCNNI